MRNEPVMANGDAVLTGQLYVVDGVVRVSTIGLPGAAKTVTDLKTLLSATEVRRIDVPGRRLQTSFRGEQLFDDA